jgi:hypothetical protein
MLNLLDPFFVAEWSLAASKYDSGLAERSLIVAANNL